MKINRDRHQLEKMGQTPFTNGDTPLRVCPLSRVKGVSPFVKRILIGVCPYLIFAALFLFPDVFGIAAEQGNVIIKLVAVNPSKGQTQKVTLKAYLPKEAKPDDVVDMADLTATYDTQQGSYFVSGEYEIKPGEFLERDVEIKDIWVVPDKEISQLRQEVAQVRELLKNTDYAERIDFLKTSVDNKLNQIIESQLNAPINPERHISNYRDNLKTMDIVKQDMVLARSLLSQGKGLPTTAVWKLIFAIIIFLAFLGISFYVIWQKQLKLIINDTLIDSK